MNNSKPMARQTCYTPEEAELVAAAIAAKVDEAPPLPEEAQRLIRAAVTNLNARKEMRGV